ncbi:MAG: hypothetical protein RJA20_2894 [Bacteroidota bacterium]
MKHLLLTVLLITACTTVFSQKVVVEGTVTDTVSVPLTAATVVAMTPDSVMSAFGMTDASGKFNLRIKGPGRFLLQVTYVGYETQWREFSLDATLEKRTLDPVRMSVSYAVLPSVEISAERDPMRISRDTVDYNAAAFRVQPGAPVEDLLKKLPGVEVQRDGSVKAMGETVQNVLVDGKEFFGKDTRIATKNLPAEAVDRVQVFDKQSEMAEFTGIKDGNEERTINLKLKDTHRHGYFGKADAGAGTDYRYEGRMNLNRFSPGGRLSMIGMANNTNEVGFSLNDYIQMLGGMGAMMSGGGFSFSMNDGSVPLADERAGSGIRTSLAGGLNFSKDFSKNTELTASYFANQFKNDLYQETVRLNLGTESIFSNFERTNQYTNSYGHNLNLNFKTRPDSFQQIIVRAGGGFSGSTLENIGLSYANTAVGGESNRGTRYYEAEGIRYNVQSNFTWRRKFRKTGRALVAQSTLNANNGGSDGLLDAVNTFYLPQTLADTLAQRQAVTDKGVQAGISLAYTEPFGDRKYLEFSASTQNYSNTNTRDFYDMVPGGEQLNALLTNQFRRGYRYDRAGLNLLVNKGKQRLNAGFDVQQSILNNENLLTGQPFNARFARLLPSANWEYEIRTGTRLNADYQTRFTEPSPEQLQPAVDNSNPLSIYIGNPGLRPEYVHELRTGFFLYDQFSFTSFFANITGTYIKDRITNATNIDEFLRRTVTPVNVSHETAIKGNIQFGAPIKPLKIKFNLKLNSRYTQRLLYLNNVLNHVNDWRGGGDFSVENRRKDKVDALFGFRLNNTTTHWSLNTVLNQQFVNHQWYTDVKYTPTSKWLIETQFDYTIYSAETFGERMVVPLWKAGITRYILKNNRGRIRVSAFDLLDKNISVVRSSSLNYLEEQRSNTLNRYFLLTFGYSLSGFEQEKGGIHLKID